MQSKFVRFIPSSLETWGILFVTLLLLLLGNAHDLMERYGLIGSSSLVKTQLSQSVGSGLSKLDSFTITRSVVTFLLWGVVGLIIFSVVQTLLGASGRLRYDRSLSSKQYVHPVGFNRNRFWHSVLLDSLMSFALLILFVAGALLYILFIIPVGFTYTRHLLRGVSVNSIENLLLGIFTIFVGTYILYTVAKAVTWHHRKLHT